MEFHRDHYEHRAAITGDGVIAAYRTPE